MEREKVEFAFMEAKMEDGEKDEIMDVEQGEEGNYSSPEGAEKVNRKQSFYELYKIQRITPNKDSSVKQTMLLAFQTLGVVYGDLGTSPLYTFPSIRLANPKEKDILGIFSIIFWTLTLICVIKYVCIVLHADDHGEGGTFALYSFLCQHINFQNKFTIQNTRLDSDTNLKYYSSKSALQSKAKKFLEGSTKAQAILTFAVLLGTCMVIGDGALTPAISVLSAVQGIQSRSSNIHQMHVVLIAVVVLILLFLLERIGTSKVSFVFSPVMLIWLLCIAFMGIYNIATYYPTILKGMSPYYVYLFFKRNGKTGWKLLGSIALCITGAEAMFADLGHFNKRAIQVAFTCILYPTLILTYSGQAAYLIKHPQDMSTAFYSSVPSPVFWPIFIIATLAAVVGSQCLISASFSIIKHSMALGCFPRVTMVHTSDKYEGQVYSPEVNYFLMVACILVVVGFKGDAEIGNAYGVVVIWVMLITTCLMTVIMLVVWDTNLLLILLFLGVFSTVEGVYMTSLLNKLPQGGWVPFAISCFLLIITLSWTHGRRKKNDYDAERMLSLEELAKLVLGSSNKEVLRVPGICFFCTNLVNGVPPIIRHYVQNVGSLHEIMVIITLRTLPIKSVLPEERFVVGRMGPQGVYRCLVQYGYKDAPSLEGDNYVTLVIEMIKELEAERLAQVALIESAMNNGVTYVMGRTILKSKESNGWFSHIVIDYVYRFLHKNSRSTLSSLRLPASRTLQVGVMYEI